MPQIARHYWILGLALIFVIVIFYVHHIQTTYMIDDEYLVYRFTRGTLAETIDYLANRDVHPPFWFSFFWVWRRLVGESDFAGRMQAILFSMITLSVVYQLGRRWFRAARFGLFSVAILGVSSLFLWYSLEIRPYALAMLLASLSMLAFQRWLNLRTRRAAIFYAVSLAALLYIHYFLLLFILAQVVYFLLQRPSRQLLQQGLGVMLLAFLLWSPWFPSFVTQFQHIRAVELASGAARGAAGSSATTEPTSFESIWSLVQLATNGQVGLYAGLLLVGAIYGWRKRNFWLALAWALGVPVIAFGLNFFVAVYAPRYVVNFVIGLALVLGAGLAFLPWRWRWGALMLFAGISLWALPTQLPDDIIPYSQLFGDMSAQAQPGDKVLLDQSNYAEAKVMQWQLLHVVPEWLRTDTTDKLDAVLPARRIWYVTANWLNDDVHKRYLEIEATHPRQTGFGQCNSQWCYLIQLMEAPPWTTPQVFGADMAFWGADVDNVSRESIQTRLWWKVDHAPALDYSIGLQLLDANGTLVAQADGPINHYGQEVVNTSQLEPERIYIDFRNLTLPANVPAGDYQLEMVVYDWQTNQRLLLMDGSDHLTLNVVTIR
ncbi:MAG: glycosyltransferase family 39 protein [Chloroflexota bacterium]